MALQDISANLLQPAQRNGAGALDALMIEEFEGTVHEKYQVASISDGTFMMTPLYGTDTMSNAAMGDPTLQAVVPGVEPEGKQIEVGDQIVQVKTPIIARVTEAMLAKVQDRLNVYGRTPGAFARVIAKAVDEIQLHKCVQAAMKTTGAGEVADLAGGTKITMDLAGDELDATKLEKKIRAAALQVRKNEGPMEDGYLYATWDVIDTLHDADKLISTDYSTGNGDYSAYSLRGVAGFKLVGTNRLPTTENAAHIMGAAYNISAAEAKTLACWATPSAIMSAQSVPLTSDAYWDQRLLTYFLDSYLAFGTAIDRPDNAAVILKA